MRPADWLGYGYLQSTTAKQPRSKTIERERCRRDYTYGIWKAAVGIPPPTLDIYSSFLDTFGSINHSAIRHTKKARIIGCKTRTPSACAKTPTTNGKIEAPTPANAAIKPMTATCWWRGRRLLATRMTPGKSGPRKNPWKATATAET